MVFLRFGPFRAIKGLMGCQVIHGSEFNTTSGTYQLNERRGRRTGRRWTAYRTFPCLTIVFLMSNEVLMSAKNDVALFTPETIIKH